MGVREDIDTYTAMLTEAKTYRDRTGDHDATGDARYQQRVIEGDFTGLIRGWRHPEDAEIYGTGAHRTRVAVPVAIGAPARQGGSTYAPDGHQGAKPERVSRIQDGRMIGERPAQGSGRYGTRKQQITKDASPAQLDWIGRMMDELATLDTEAHQAAQAAMDEYTARDNGRLTGGYGGTASKIIDLLKLMTKTLRAKNTTQAARPAARREPLPQVPDGYYAITGADGATKFYRVKNHRNGRVYVNVQASDDWHDVKFGAYRAILAEVARDPQAAGKRYADELGRCYLCSRALTDEESRTFGTGPDCGNRR
jgi:hypothetical protein